MLPPLLQGTIGMPLTVLRSMRKKVPLLKTMHKMSMTRHNQQELAQISSTYKSGLLPKKHSKMPTPRHCTNYPDIHPHKQMYMHIYSCGLPFDLKAWRHKPYACSLECVSSRKINQASKSTLMLKEEKLSKKR